MVRPLIWVRQNFAHYALIKLARDARRPIAFLATCLFVALAGAGLQLSGRAYAADANSANPRTETLIGTFRTKPSPGPSSNNLPVGPNQALAASRSAEDSFLREAGDRIFFSSGSAEIGARARAVLVAQAEWLKRQPQVRLTVEGHADDGGTTEQNVTLSAQRATAVRERLIAEGVDARRITTAARGREDRIAVCAGPACAAQNRRTVTIVYPVGSGARLGADMPRDRSGGEPDTALSDPSGRSRVPR